jgi:F-type H+-transporting ATPase subunit delta
LSKNKGFSITSADRYSLALYELASENNILSQVEDQSLSILSLISSSKDFSNLIKNPTNSQEDLLKVLGQYF